MAQQLGQVREDTMDQSEDTELGKSKANETTDSKHLNSNSKFRLEGGKSKVDNDLKMLVY